MKEKLTRASDEEGRQQGGVLSPMLSNIYRTTLWVCGLSGAFEKAVGEKPTSFGIRMTFWPAFSTGRMQNAATLGGNRPHQLSVPPLLDPDQAPEALCGYAL